MGCIDYLSGCAWLAAEIGFVSQPATAGDIAHGGKLNRVRNRSRRFLRLTPARLANRTSCAGNLDLMTDFRLQHTIITD